MAFEAGGICELAACKPGDSHSSGGAVSIKASEDMDVEAPDEIKRQHREPESVQEERQQRLDASLVLLSAPGRKSETNFLWRNDLGRFSDDPDANRTGKFTLWSRINI